jgi:hypothetical protein
MVRSTIQRFPRQGAVQFEMGRYSIAACVGSPWGLDHGLGLILLIIDAGNSLNGRLIVRPCRLGVAAY